MKRAAFTFLFLMALVPCVATAAPNPRDFFANARDSEFASAVSNGDREKLERQVQNGGERGIRMLPRAFLPG